jgi:hypothetical protein
MICRVANEDLAIHRRLMVRMWRPNSKTSRRQAVLVRNGSPIDGITQERVITRALAVARSGAGEGSRPKLGWPVSLCQTWVSEQYERSLCSDFMGITP